MSDHSTQPSWTPKAEITEAEFFAMSHEELRALFPAVDDFARELMRDQREAGLQQQEKSTDDE